MWAGWDIRDTEEDNRFHQVSFGLEALSERFDLRVNGYVPITDPKGSPGLAEVFLRGNNILMIGGEEVPLYGVDGEVGVLLFGGTRGGGGGSKDAPVRVRNHELRGYVGGFWFDDDDAVEEVAGPKGRLEYRINDVIAGLPGSRLTLESELSYDEVRDTKFEIGARLRIPFGARGGDALSRHAALTGQELRMIEGLERDTDIITVQSKEENVFDALTNVNFDRAAVLQGGGDLQGTLNTNGPNSLIILNGGTTNGSFIVGPSQTLQGGGSTIKVTGVRSRTTANFRAPGSKPFIVQTLDNPILTIDNNTHIAGLGLTGAGQGSGLGNNDGIVPVAAGVSNVAITHTMIMDVGGTGIQFSSDHNKVIIYDTSIQRTGNAGINFGSDNNDIRVSDLTITDADNAGVNHGSRNTNLTYENVWISNTAQSGINFGGDTQNATFRNVNIATAGNAGINFGSGNAILLFDDVTVTNVTGSGLNFSNNNSNVTITNSTITNAGVNGINFNDNNSNVTIANSTITDPGTDGIFFNNNNSNVTIATSTITDAFEGIEFDDDNTNITISQMVITTSGSSGIDIGDRNINTVITNSVIDGTGGESISFNEDNSGVTINTVTVRNSLNDGIDFDDGSSNIVITNATLENIADAALQFDSNHANVTITDTTATNVGIGFQIQGTNSAATLSNLTITNATEDGFQIIGGSNSVTMNNTTFIGQFASDVIDINQPNNTLAGNGNVFNGAFGNQFCNVVGGQIGAFNFEVAPQPTCP